MRVVSSNTEADIARERAVRDLEWPLRELAANLLRVMRGAGKAYLLGRQMVDVIDAYNDYKQVVGCYPDDYEISEILRDPLRTNTDKLDDFACEEVYAERALLAGAMQVLASKLAAQRTQETVGGREMWEGIRAVEKARKARNADWDKRWAARQAAEAAERKSLKPQRRPKG